MHLILQKTLFNKSFVILLVVIIILVAIYFYGRKAGLDKALKYGSDLPNSGSGIPQNWDPKPLAQEGYEAMDGAFSKGSILKEWYTKLMALTDDQFTAVYNKFNQLYISEGYGTMHDWIDGESFMEQPIDRSHEPVLERLNRLNLLKANPADLSWWKTVI
jgi:hypothetical protein